MSYQGWKNYETWHVALMLNQDANVQRDWLDNANSWWTEANKAPHEVWTTSEHARYLVADALEQCVDDDIVELDELQDGSTRSHLLLGLLRAGFDEVYWEEIANGFLEKCEGYEPTTYEHKETDV